jgi:predicted PurR-regulated permease PerM
LIIVLGLAAGVIVAAGMHAVPNILGPVFLALVLVITIDPLRSMMIRRGAPRWLATLVLVLGMYAIIIGLMVAGIIGVARLASLLPQYADELQNELAGLKTWLEGFGITQADVQQMLSSVDKSTIVSYAASLLSSLAGVFTSLFFIITLLIFLAVDGSVFGDRMVSRRPGREPVLTALGTFAAGTRKYFAVATIFGGIVAILDGAALLILGIPAAGLWALLAFVTNYIPNIGFIIGLVPPALLGLLVGGPSLAITVIVVYCVLNFVIQSVLQPKFVGDAVGLTTTMSFLSLIVWAYILGPIGAILAIPASLLFKALLIDVDPDAKWLQLFFGDEPVFKVKDPDRPKRKLIGRKGSKGASSSPSPPPDPVAPAT